MRSVTTLVRVEIEPVPGAQGGGEKQHVLDLVGTEKTLGQRVFGSQGTSHDQVVQMLDGKAIHPDVVEAVRPFIQTDLTYAQSFRVVEWTFRMRYKETGWLVVVGSRTFRPSGNEVECERASAEAQCARGIVSDKPGVEEPLPMLRQ